HATGAANTARFRIRKKGMSRFETPGNDFVPYLPNPVVDRGSHRAVVCPACAARSADGDHAVPDAVDHPLCDRALLPLGAGGAPAAATPQAFRRRRKLRPRIWTR